MFIFALVAFAFSAKSKASLPKRLSKELTPVFSSKSFIVVAFLFRFLSQPHSSEWNVDIQRYQHHLLLKSLFSPYIIFLTSCWKSIGHKCKDLFLNSFLVSHCLICFSIICFETGKSKSLNFFFFNSFRIGLAILAYLHIHMYFKERFSLKKNKS